MIKQIIEKLIKNKLFKIIIVLGVCLIVFLFLKQNYFYKWIGYETVPNPAITDEFNYVWQALTLRKTGIPIAWSNLDSVYRNPKYNFTGATLEGFGMKIDNKIISINDFIENRKPMVAVKQVDYNKGLEYMYFVAPFFDHSPLGGLVFSSTINDDVVGIEQVTTKDFRKPALIVGVLTSILVFVLSYLISNNLIVSFAGMLVYSTVPTFVLASRMAYLENIAAPLVLMFLIFSIIADKLIAKKTLSRMLHIVSGLVAGFSFLAKEPAIGFVLGLFLVMILRKIPIRNIVAFCVSFLFPVFLYISWGMWLQKDIFLAVFLANNNRHFFGSLKIVTMLISLRFENFPVDGWWTFGGLSLILTSLNRNIHRGLFTYLSIPVFSHIVLLALMGSPNYPWYYLILIPFVSIGAGYILWKILTKPNFVYLLTFLLLAFSTSYYWGYTMFNQGSDLQLFRIFMILSIVLLVLKKKCNHFIFQYGWNVYILLMFYELFKWNQRSILFFVSNWGNYPIPPLPNL